MRKIAKIAWRNVWRNKVRSLIIIASAAIGLWGGTFILGISSGVSEQRKQDLIKSQLSHIQIHDPEYLKENEVQYFIPEGQGTLEQINKNEKVEAAAGRVVINGMAASANGASGVKIYGIYPEQEQLVTDIKEKVTEGHFFEEETRNPILIGEALAKKRNLKLNSKIILTFQDTTGNLVSAAFRIIGLYRTISSKMDEMIVYTRAQDMNELIGTEDQIHEIGIFLEENAEVDSVAAAFINIFPEVKVETWKDLSPELKYMDEMMDMILYIFMGIILLALTFGLVNTMLMAVLERVRELGMLMAIGMNKLRLFMMILMETFYLAFTGGVIGMILAFVTIQYYSEEGIHIPGIEEGMGEFGMSNVIYPALDLQYYPILAVMIFSFALLAAVYPAIKALQLKPADAIRKI